MPKHVVRQGESLPSIAKDKGFLWRTLWDLPENGDLKSKRKDPNVLATGDEVFVPDLRPKEETGATEQTHKFKRKGNQVKFKLRLTRMDEPRANEDYILEIDGKLISGKTDGDGVLEEDVPGNARGGSLILRGGIEVHPIKIGHLDPVDEPSGIRQRLNNLGFACGPLDGEPDARTKEALKGFQAKHELEVTGALDEATKNKVKALYP